MSKGREIRCYDYVNHPYDRVREAMRGDALALFQKATKAAETRAETIASELKLDVGGITIGTDIRIVVKSIEDRPASGGQGPSTALELEWEAVKMPGLFPQMKAELLVYPLTSTETQLDFAGTYEAPLGAVGGLLDAVAGHRIAEVCVHRFVTTVAGHLRQALAGS